MSPIYMHNTHTHTLMHRPMMCVLLIGSQHVKWGKRQKCSNLLRHIFERCKIQFHGKFCIRELGISPLAGVSPLARGKKRSCPRFTSFTYAHTHTYTHAHTHIHTHAIMTA
ncbi:hypothetical protein HOLleu_30175 [Holothuria leucospilota]|uniref:Uncharacterized protein n=1 Tax=Holothuria leucospilota TaxID=206669 RepID=A0A9Q1GZ68_HOLLE|nr:hypothetical protein HOLleu_30175 [Holothuria leucospilota]